MQIILSLIFFSILSFALSMEFSNITYTNISIKSNYFYKLEAEYYVNKIAKNNAFTFFINRYQYMMKNNYYSNGFLKASKSKLYFKKAFILGGNVYLFNVLGVIDNQRVKAKEVIFNGYNKYTLKKCEIKTKKKIYRRKEYIIMSSSTE